MLRISLSLLILTVLLLTAGAPPARATWSARNDATPGAASSAGFKGKLYIFARNADNSLKFRTGDGRDYSGWTPLPIGGASASYPAAATATDGSFLALFHRSTGNTLLVSRTFDGTNFETWRNIGGVLTSAPSAAAFNGRIHVFVRAPDYSIHTRSSSDAVNWSNWTSLGGRMSSAPVATVMRRSDGQSQIVVIVRNEADAKLYQRTSTDGVNFTPWFKRSETMLAINPADQADFPIVADLGFNFNSPDNPAGSWGSYKLPVFSTSQAQLAKFNLVYDSTFPNPGFSASHLQDAINRGAITIILRLADTKIRPQEVKRQLEAPLRDSNQSVLGFIAAHPYQQFWIEVGNEPNLGCNAVDPFMARYHLLTTIQNVASLYRTSHPNLRWMASLPTRHGFKREPEAGCCPNCPPGEGCCRDSVDPVPAPNPPDAWSGLNYLDIILSDTGDGRGSILSGLHEYDAVGVHMFGFNKLQQGFPGNTQNGTVCSEDFDCPTVVLDRVLAKTAKTIFITEAGINTDTLWACPSGETGCWEDPENPYKTTRHIRAMRRLPAQVRGYVVWTADLDRIWCDPNVEKFAGFYSFDATYHGEEPYCSVDPQLSGSWRFNAR